VIADLLEHDSATSHVSVLSAQNKRRQPPTPTSWTSVPATRRSNPPPGPLPGREGEAHTRKLRRWNAPRYPSPPPAVAYRPCSPFQGELSRSDW